MRRQGALLSLYNEGCGEIIREGRGLIDVAWPVKYDYETLRADPCGKHKPCRPVIQGDDKQIVLEYSQLPMNTDMPELECLEGGISARIILTAWKDGKSVGMRCRVTNHSATPVRQILFPDLSGLQPDCGRGGDSVHRAEVLYAALQGAEGRRPICAEPVLRHQALPVREIL